MSFRNISRNSEGRFDFEKVPVNKKGTDRLNDPCSFNQFGLLAHQCPVLVNHGDLRPIQMIYSLTRVTYSPVRVSI